ncbi:protein serine/threonine phosphatase 2C [Acrodontium crateriforme]|uniref:Protein phosphatase n=1 Tax=Acrodontium crateriforme TaxID=150365 RepID=A0AAQ3M332_9PEZI|nr:protein serine/threonine phosphatase 2C [Acrodontium crateriforme]
MFFLAGLLILPVLWLSACLHDGNSSSYCLPLNHTAAVMSANNLTSLPLSVLNRATLLHRNVEALRRYMPSVPNRAYSANPSPKNAFTYRLAAAAAGKHTAPRPPKAGQDFWNYTSTQLNRSPPYLRSSKPDSGEDAFFATTIGGSENHVAFGLADGVGGWQDSGVDPSVFSHGLCGLMAGTANIDDGLEEGNLIGPQKLLQIAYDAVIGNPRIVAGGCTASLAVASKDGSMETANLGDSGFIIVGPGKVTARSNAQTHAFNTPYQLSKVPAKIQAQHAIFGGATHFSETPAQADVEKHQLKHGDIVLFATDGVWDNLSAQDTLTIITKVMEEHGYWFKSHNFAGAETMLNESLVKSMPKVITGKMEDQYLPALLATAVMREAKLAGLDRRRDGPFAREVKLHFPQESWQGGKPDDIAVVVAIAVEDVQTTDASEKPMKAKL